MSLTDNCAYHRMDLKDKTRVGSYNWVGIGESARIDVGRQLDDTDAETTVRITDITERHGVALVAFVQGCAFSRTSFIANARHF